MSFSFAGLHGTLTIIITPNFYLDKEKNGLYDLNFWDWEKDRKKA
jgi:hypothetical protein